MTVIVGVDAGLSGVITVRKPEGVLTFPTPFTFHKDRYARPVVSLPQWEEVCDAIDGDEEEPSCFVMIESPAIHGGMDSRIAVAGIWWYAGILDSIFRLDYPTAQIEYVRPQQWQKALIVPFLTAKGYPYPQGGKGARDRWKQLSIEYVRDNYGPEVLKFPRSRKENDNIADSICISEYAEKVQTGVAIFHREWVYTPRKTWKNKHSFKKEKHHPRRESKDTPIVAVP